MQCFFPFNSYFSQLENKSCFKNHVLNGNSGRITVLTKITHSGRLDNEIDGACADDKADLFGRGGGDKDLFETLETLYGFLLNKEMTELMKSRRKKVTTTQLLNRKNG